MISIDRTNNLVEVKNLNFKLYIEFLNLHKLDGIRINDADGFIGETISPYCNNNTIKKLNFSIHYNSRLDFLCIENMHWLKYLVLTIGYNENYYFDFTKLVNLELLSIDWNKNVKGLEFLTRLKSVHFAKFKGKPELFSNYALMEDIGLTQGNMKDLEFLKYFKNLNKLYLAYIPSIKDSFGLEHIYETIEEIDIEACPNLLIFEHLGKFKNLKLLRIKTKEPFHNLQWVSKLSKLEFLAIGDTNIVDGDFTPVKDVKYVSMYNKKHYNYFFDQSSMKIVKKEF